MTPLPSPFLPPLIGHTSEMTLAAALKQANPNLSATRALQLARQMQAATHGAPMMPKPEKPWQRKFTLKPVLTVDGKLVWLRHVMYRRQDRKPWNYDYLSVTGYVTKQITGRDPS